MMDEQRILIWLSERLSVCVALLAILLLGVPAYAQAPAGKSPVEGSAAGSTATVIFSNIPEHKGPVYELLEGLGCKYVGAVAGVPSSEVWSVPSDELARVSGLLQTRDVKVTKLGADWNHILNRHQGPLTPAQNELMGNAKAEPGAVGVHVMRAPDPAVSAYAMTSKKERAPARIVLPINATTNITLERTRYVLDERGSAWRGVVVETGESAVLIRWNDGQITGVVGYKGHIYRVSGLGGDLHAVIETDPRNLPPDHGPLKPTLDPRAELRPDAPIGPGEVLRAPAVTPFPDADRLALEAEQVTIDVMMLYTNRASRRSLRTERLLAVSIEEVNETFRNSGLGNISLRLVHTELVDYDESDGSHFDHLFRMVDGVGPFKDIRKLRNEKKADIVGLVVDDASGCGQSTRVAPDADEAFFVAHHSCAVIAITIAHEIGHIFGARHDRAIDPRNVPFAYGHGYVKGSKWRDIMSYRQSCGGCVRIPFWSNPRVTYKGEPMGTPMEDNARVILEQAERVSKFR